MKICPCDQQSTTLLCRIAGAQLHWIALQPYPQNAAYRQAVVATSEVSLVVSLVEKNVGAGFDVEAIQVQSTDENISLDGWDRLEFGDFRIGQVFLIRQKRWQEAVSPTNDTTIGIPRSMQISGGLEALANDDEAVIVDAGVMLCSTNGTELDLIADTFPLLIRFQMNGSIPILGDRVSLSQTSGTVQ